MQTFHHPYEDIDIVSRMRNVDQLQFESLCRMHLSFEFDFEGIEIEDNQNSINQKTNFWHKISRKWKNSSDLSTSVITSDMVTQFKFLIKYLENDFNVAQEGIFRKSGLVSRQNSLKESVLHENHSTIDLSNYTAHDCASVLKSMLSELSEPLFTLKYQEDFFKLAGFYNAVQSSQYPKMSDGKTMVIKRIQNALQLLFVLIPNENRQILVDLNGLFSKIVDQAHINKMNASNLSTIFTPSIACPRKLHSEQLIRYCKKMYGIVNLMIDLGSGVFVIPRKLVTDIQAYFLEKSTQRVKSPSLSFGSDSLLSDTTATVNTVFTFVDHSKIAETKTTTEVAIAELYAYIQSLPESTKKKRLIKQFNKENGKGTPLQVLKQNKIDDVRTNKSLNGSVKKFLYQKLKKNRIFNETKCTKKEERNVCCDLRTKDRTKNESESLFESNNHTFKCIFDAIKYLNIKKRIVRSMSETFLDRTCDDWTTLQSSYRRSASCGNISQLKACPKHIDQIEVFSLSPEPYISRSMQESIMTPRSRKPISFNLVQESKSSNLSAMLKPALVVCNNNVNVNIRKDPKEAIDQENYVCNSNDDSFHSQPGDFLELSKEAEISSVYYPSLQRKRAPQDLNDENETTPCLKYKKTNL